MSVVLSRQIPDLICLTQLPDTDGWKDGWMTSLTLILALQRYAGYHNYGIQRLTTNFFLELKGRSRRRPNYLLLVHLVYPVEAMKSSLLRFVALVYIVVCITSVHHLLKMNLESRRGLSWFKCHSRH